MVVFGFLIVLFATAAQALPLANSTNKDACASISNIYGECMAGACPGQGRSSSLGQTVSLPAHLADECLRSLPFNKTAAALQLHKVANFLQLYSAQVFWKLPPTNELGIKAVDLNDTLDFINSEIDADRYSSVYQFDLAITDALNSFHDAHTSYSTRCSVTFVFLHDYPLVAVADSPSSNPAIYLGDVATKGPVKGGKVLKINGEVPEVYLKEIAESQPYYIDQASRYSALFLQDIIPTTAVSQTDPLGLFAARDRFPTGPLNITLENGTHIDVEWRAEYNWFPQLSYGPPLTLPFESSLDLQRICRNPRFDLPRVSNEQSGLGKRDLAPRQSTEMTYPRLPASYPPAIGKLPFNEVSYFGIDGGYGVIKLASFHESTFKPYGFRAYTFPQDVYNLISEALQYFKTHDLEKVILDVSRNNGGDVNAGFLAFQAFFPSARPYYGRDLRISPLLEAANRVVQNEDFTASVLEKSADYGIYTDVTGRNYSSPRQFLDPAQRDSDHFTRLSRANVPASLKRLTVPEPKNVSFTGPALFAAANIILLSDSHCASACSVFAEAMREMGVSSVVYGGPASSKGKMQVSGGTKGAASINNDDIFFQQYSSVGLEARYVPKEPPYSMLLSTNLVNAYRKGEDEIPLEFQLTPATVTMQLTAKMLVSIEERWRVAAETIWGNATTTTE